MMKGFKIHFRIKSSDITILLQFAFDNGDMSSLKRHVFISLLSILKYLAIIWFSFSATTKLSLEKMNHFVQLSG